MLSGTKKLIEETLHKGTIGIGSTNLSFEGEEDIECLLYADWKAQHKIHNNLYPAQSKIEAAINSG